MYHHPQPCRCTAQTKHRDEGVHAEWFHFCSVQNQSMLLEVRTVVSLGERWLVSGRGRKKASVRFCFLTELL